MKGAQDSDKGKRSDSVLLQKPYTHNKFKKQRDKNFDYRMIADRLKTVSSSNNSRVIALSFVDFFGFSFGVGVLYWMPINIER